MYQIQFFSFNFLIVISFIAFVEAFAFKTFQAHVISLFSTILHFLFFFVRFLLITFDKKKNIISLII